MATWWVGRRGGRKAALPQGRTRPPRCLEGLFAWMTEPRGAGALGEWAGQGSAWATLPLTCRVGPDARGAGPVSDSWHQSPPREQQKELSMGGQMGLRPVLRGAEPLAWGGRWPSTAVVEQCGGDSGDTSLSQLLPPWTWDKQGLQSSGAGGPTPEQLSPVLWEGKQARSDRPTSAGQGGRGAPAPASLWWPGDLRPGEGRWKSVSWGLSSKLPRVPPPTPDARQGERQLPRRETRSQAKEQDV